MGAARLTTRSIVDIDSDINLNLKSDAHTISQLCPDMEKLREQKGAILALASRFGARRIRVFGSVARNQQSAASDVDFLVDFPPGYDMLSQRVPLMQKLSELLECRVDLVPEHELDVEIRARALEEAIDL